MGYEALFISGVSQETRQEWEFQQKLEFFWQPNFVSDDEDLNQQQFDIFSHVPSPSPSLD